MTSKDRMGNILMVGFNRRFSPLTDFLRERIGAGPMSMIYRINAGALPADSWIQNREVSGGRIIGEVCHFIDLLTFINGSLPEKVQAFGMIGPVKKVEADTVNINVKFENGSIGVISYFANGHKDLPKEYLEVYKDGATAILRDFREVEILSSNKRSTKRLFFQDKGQAAKMRTFVKVVKNGDSAPIPFGEISAVTLATFRAVESLLSASSILVGSDSVREF
jgi:predicted dehydrogenase